MAGSISTLMIMRFLFGAAESGAYPASARVIKAWLPVRQRGVAQGIIFAGSRIGAAVGLAFTSWLIANFGWRGSFGALSVAGLVWMVCWLLWFRNTPEKPVETEGEEQLPVAMAAPTSQKIFVSDGSRRRSAIEIAILMFQYAASNYTFFVCFTWLLPYLRTRYSLSSSDAGLLASIPLYAGAAANWISGVMVDRLYRSGRARDSRIIPACLGFLLAAIALCVAVRCQKAWGAVLWLAIATFGVDFTLSPSWTLCIDISGEQTATLTGAMNMFGNLGSFLSSLAFPFLFRWTGRSDTFFYSAAALNLCASFLWLSLRNRSFIRTNILSRS